MWCSRGGWRWRLGRFCGTLLAHGSSWRRALVELPPAIFLMGPTAVGKTQLAVELVQRLPCAIISVDSTMVYRGLDIGTAKPDAALLEIAPHALIDIRDPADPYSAAQFREDALREMGRIVAQGRIPLLVGGTMLYFRALVHGLSELPAARPEVRRALEADARQLGWPALHARLAKIDPPLAARIHPNDPQRIQRALEIHALTGRAPTELFKRNADQSFPYRVFKRVVAPGNRSWLHARIARRFAQMLREGLVEEVEVFYNTIGLNLDKPAMRAVGYRQVWEYLDGSMSYDAMVERAVSATRQLARRQLTWLRAEPDTWWFDCGEGGVAQGLLKSLKALPI